MRYSSKLVIVRSGGAYECTLQAGEAGLGSYHLNPCIQLTLGRLESEEGREENRNYYFIRHPARSLSTSHMASQCVE